MTVNVCVCVRVCRCASVFVHLFEFVSGCVCVCVCADGSFGMNFVAGTCMVWLHVGSVMDSERVCPVDDLFQPPNADHLKCCALLANVFPRKCDVTVVVIVQTVLMKLVVVSVVYICSIWILVCFCTCYWC